MKIEIEDRDYLAGKVAEIVMDRLQDHYRNESTIERLLAKAVADIISENAEKMTVEALRPRIEAALDGDFGSTDSYGNRKPRTLRAMIVECFTSYNGSSRSWIAELVEKKLAEVMKAEFQPQIDEARKTLRTKLDHILGEKVSLAVREAVGLR